MHLSATKILNFLINDMLDYAQLSAGKFRKNAIKFDVIKSVDDIAKIMKFKADELGVKLDINLNGLFKDQPKLVEDN